MPNMNDFGERISDSNQNLPCLSLYCKVGLSGGGLQMIIGKT